MTRPLATWVVNWFIASSWGHALEQNDEAGARVLLIGQEEQAGVIGHPLPPRRPAFGDDVRAIVVAVGAAQDPRATIGLMRSITRSTVTGRRSMRCWSNLFLEAPARAPREIGCAAAQP